MMIRTIGILLFATVLAGPGEAEAQRWFVGIGGTLAAVHERETDVSALRPGVHLALGYRLGPSVAVGMEGTVYGLGDDEPRLTDFSPGTGTLERRPEVAGTQVLLAFVQLETAGIYVRPGIGLGRHAFPAYLVQGPENEVVDAYVSHEAGLAGGIAAGYAVPLGGRASVGFEGAAAWSGGEDSSGSRRVFGLRIVPTFTF
jgi:hypothetical protein